MWIAWPVVEWKDISVDTLVYACTTRLYILYLEWVLVVAIILCKQNTGTCNMDLEHLLTEQAMEDKKNSKKTRRFLVVDGLNINHV